MSGAHFSIASVAVGNTYPVFYPRARTNDGTSTYIEVLSQDQNPANAGTTYGFFGLMVQVFANAGGSPPTITYSTGGSQPVNTTYGIPTGVSKFLSAAVSAYPTPPNPKYSVIMNSPMYAGSSQVLVASFAAGPPVSSGASAAIGVGPYLNGTLRFCALCNWGYAIVYNDSGTLCRMYGGSTENSATLFRNMGLTPTPSGALSVVGGLFGTIITAAIDFMGNIYAITSTNAGIYEYRFGETTPFYQGGLARDTTYRLPYSSTDTSPTGTFVANAVFPLSSPTPSPLAGTSLTTCCAVLISSSGGAMYMYNIGMPGPTGQAFGSFIPYNYYYGVVAPPSSTRNVVPVTYPNGSIVPLYVLWWGEFGSARTAKVRVLYTPPYVVAGSVGIDGASYLVDVDVSSVLTSTVRFGPTLIQSTGTSIWFLVAGSTSNQVCVIKFSAFSQTSVTVTVQAQPDYASSPGANLFDASPFLTSDGFSLPMLSITTDYTTFPNCTVSTGPLTIP